MKRHLPFRRVVRHLLLSITFVPLYLLLASPPTIIIYRLGTAAWYPAIGLVIGLLLGVSPFYAPLVALCGMLAGPQIYGEPLHSFAQTLGAVGFVTSYTTAAYVLRRPWRIDLGLHRRRDVVRYIVVACAAATVNTFVGTACLGADGSVEWRDFWPTAYSWFLGDSIGLVGIAPFLLVHVLPRVRRWLCLEGEQAGTPAQPRPGRVTAYEGLEVAAQLVSFAFLAWLMFASQWGRYRTFFLAVVPIVWIAMRHGIRRVVTGTLVFNFSIVLAMDLAAPPVDLLIKISLLMLVVSSVGLIVGSEVSERNRVAAHLQEQTAYLNALIENSPLGIVVFNQQGRMDFANPAFEKLLLCNQKDLLIGDIAPLWLQGVTSVVPKALAGETCHSTVRQKRKDGKTLDLALHAVPLNVEGEVRGVYAIYEDITEQVCATEAERKHAESQSQLVRELQARTQQMGVLNDMGAHLQSCARAREAFAVIAQFAQRLFPAAISGTLYILKNPGKTLETAEQFGAESYSESRFPVDSCAGVRRAQANWHNLCDATVTCYHIQPHSGHACLCVPIAGQEDLFGVLHLEFSQMKPEPADATGSRLQENWQSLATTVAAQAGLSLSAIRLRENLRDQAIRDPLTRLYNRRYLEEALDTELQRAARGRYPVSLLFLDLDHFKRFNDTFGHAAGDVVLQSVAVLLRGFFRTTDLCCRVGGEEFAVILPEATPETAVVRANALRLDIKGMELRHADQPLGRVTVSIGVAAFPTHASTPQQLLQIADACMYKSKVQGRDRATLAGSQMPQALVP